MIDNTIGEHENFNSLPKADVIRHRIVFCYEKNEHMPYLLGWSHGLKEKNLYTCSSSIVSESEDDLIIKKTITEENVDIIMTFLYRNNRFHTGTIIYNDKEYKIIDINMYYSLQIESYCYDNIGVIKLDYETGNKLFNKN